MANVFDQAGFMSGASKEDFYDRAVEEIENLLELSEQIPGIEESGKYNLILTAVLIGFMDDGKLSNEEEEMLKTVVDRVEPEWTDILISDCKCSVEEAFTKLMMYKMIGAMLGTNSIVITVVNLALTFAYIDGKFDDDIANRLFALLSGGNNIYMGSPEDYLNECDDEYDSEYEYEDELDDEYEE